MDFSQQKVDFKLKKKKSQFYGGIIWNFKFYKKNKSFLGQKVTIVGYLQFYNM